MILPPPKQRDYKRDDLLFLDSETCGLHSMAVLLQYAVGDGEIELYSVWKEPVWKTLKLIEFFTTKVIVGFNLTFDWFHIVKLYTIWNMLPKDWIPEEHIDEIAMIEKEGRDGPCVKPESACDLLLHSRKGPYQALMARDDVRVRRVPTALAYALADRLEEEIEIDGIFFARSKDKDAPRWKVYDIFKHGELDDDFKDVVLKFNPAGGLKFLAEYALGYEPKFHFKDVELPKSDFPIEYGWAPFALAVSTPDQQWAVWEEKDGKPARIKGYAWPAIVQKHIDHWHTHENAREYARDDIVYTRGLYDHFKQPTPGDDDSILSCMVPVVRWRGFEIDKDGMQELLAEAQKVVDESPVNVNAPHRVRDYMMEVMDESEGIIIEDSTAKDKLEAIAEWHIEEDEQCIKCFTEPGECCRCNNTGMMHRGLHPAAVRAKELLTVKAAVEEVKLYKKLVQAGRFHADFNIIGTMSSRMSGTGGLNAQGIKKSKSVRKMFPLAWDGYTLCGGDFDAFEVTLADAVYNDPQLRRALTTKVECHKCQGKGKVKHKDCDGEGCDECEAGLVTCSGCEGCGKAVKKIHGLFGMALFPGKTYEEILASDGSDYDMYTMAKSGVFAMIYGGNADTLHRNLGIPIETAEAAYKKWGDMFPGIEKARQRILRNFCSMKQPGGIGSQVIWDDPSEYCETFLGFRRNFSLENKVCKALFDLARRPPREWRKCPVKVVRRDRIQTAGGAVSSALYGSAFGIQQANMRAAANHEIQSPGGQITKHVQCCIWGLQPVGIHPLYVAPMNIHDEVQCVSHPDYVEDVAEAVRRGTESFRERVPLIGMTWNKVMANWAEKKGGSVTLKIRPPELEPDYVAPEQQAA